MANIIVVLIIVVVVGSALRYIRKQRKSGVHCIGCPSSGSCSRGCGCGGGNQQEIKEKSEN